MYLHARAWKGGQDLYKNVLKKAERFRNSEGKIDASGRVELTQFDIEIQTLPAYHVTPFFCLIDKGAAQS